MEGASGTQQDNNNEDGNGASMEACSITSSRTTSDSETEDVDLMFNANLYEFISRMQSGGKGKLPPLFEVPGKINPKYYSKRCMKNTEVAKSIPVPPTFQKIMITTDPLLTDGYVILSKNRASKIFYAIARAVFYTSDSLLAHHAKLMYLKQIEKDYNAAKKSKNNKEIRRCIKLVNKTVSEYDHPWFDEEWLVASKAFFAPFHILFHCPRVPCNPHIVRYQFSPVLNDERKIRICLDNGDYVCGDEPPKNDKNKNRPKTRKR